MRSVYNRALFRSGTGEKELLLTFDDSPSPHTTPALLEMLEKLDIKALFFCTGEAAAKNPWLTELIVEEGHIAGNHGFKHLDGWKTSTQDYIINAVSAEPYVPAKIFRPPYGRMKPGQYNRLAEMYKIVLWDVMPYDFDTSFSSSDCLRVLKNKVRPGSIIVLHDKPGSSVRSFLEEFADWAFNEGYRFSLPIFS